MLALVDRDDAHGGVDVDADEYMCGMDGTWYSERERERKRERVFVCVVQQSERLPYKKIASIHFFRDIFCG